jgi:hypothetical protein
MVMAKAAPILTDPTIEAMRAFLTDQFGEADEFDREQAIYWFASDYHGGQWSNLYSALCTSEYKPGTIERGVEPETMADLCYQALVGEFSGQVASLAEYAPYNEMPAFKVGAQAYAKGDYHCPYSADSVEGQAWDRGLEYAMRLERVR